MKFSPKIYSEAFIQAIHSSPEEKEKLTKSFAKLIRKNGDLSLLPKIVEYLKGLLVKEKGGQRIKIEFAREPQKKLAQTLMAKFKKEDLIEISINPDLVAGVRINIDGEKELDNSLIRKLNKIFK